MNNNEKNVNNFPQSKPVKMIPETLAKKRQYISSLASAIISGTLVLGGVYIKDKLSAEESPKNPIEPAEVTLPSNEKIELVERKETPEKNLCEVKNDAFNFVVTSNGLVKIESFGENLDQTYGIATENFEKCINDFLSNSPQKYSAFVNQFKMRITQKDGKYRVAYSLPLVKKKENERHIENISLKNGNHKALANGKDIFTDIEGKDIQTTLIMKTTSVNSVK